MTLLTDIKSALYVSNKTAKTSHVVLNPLRKRSNSKMVTASRAFLLGIATGFDMIYLLGNIKHCMGVGL
jgi:hypothetical protein